MGRTSSTGSRPFTCFLMPRFATPLSTTACRACGSVCPLSKKWNASRRCGLSVSTGGWRTRARKNRQSGRVRMQQTRERFPLVCTDKLFNDFVEYSTVQMRNNDLDPEYLVLGHFTQGASLENAVWATILHVSYCHIISLLLALQRFPEPAPLDDWALKLPIFVDRRNLRGGKLGQHINHWLEVKHAYGGLVPYLTDQFGDSPTDNWLSLRQKLLAIWGNGRWAGYKTAEILWRIHGFAVYPTDMDNSNSSGPRKGLAFFYGPVAGNTPAVIAHLDAQAEDLLARLQAEGIDIEIDELETMLCEFHSMPEGRYY